MADRIVENSWKSKLAIDGAGVKLRRAFGFGSESVLDPFLLLDVFGSDNSDDYIAGFPWHPHRGIETITYVLHGEVQHEDSLGNGGTIKSGDVQWMTAGSGIIHQEMPLRGDGKMWGFQLWANLPSEQKMMHPRYRDITSDDIPIVSTDQGATIRIIAGEYNKVQGPVSEIVIEPQYYDIALDSESIFTHSIPNGHTLFAYIFEGSGFFDSRRKTLFNLHTLVKYTANGSISIESSMDGVRFLLVSGKPLNEPIAWRGPIVMNTEAELQLAFREYRAGSFIKHQK